MEEERDLPAVQDVAKGYSSPTLPPTSFDPGPVIVDNDR